MNEPTLSHPVAVIDRTTNECPSGIRLSAVLAFLLALGVGVFGTYKAISSSFAETRASGEQPVDAGALAAVESSAGDESLLEAAGGSPKRERGTVAPRSIPCSRVGFVERSEFVHTGTAEQVVTRLTPIETLQVGQRVRADAPTDDVDLQFGHQVVASEWRKLILTAPKKNGTVSDVVLLRPLRWIEQQRAEVNGQVYISVPECGIDGNATVHRIEPCPPIIDGRGEVITGTFRHRVSGGIELTVEGESQPIRCTGNHPIWSEDRHDFVRADSLQPGETLRTVNGPAEVVASKILPGETYVYKIEVHRAHVYHVGNDGLLVHNGDPEDCIKWARRFATKEGGEAFSVLPRKLAGNIEQLPGYAPRDGGWNVHAFVIKDGKIFDAVHQKGIPVAEWWGEYARLNQHGNVFEAGSWTRIIDGLEAAMEWPRNDWF